MLIHFSNPLRRLESLAARVLRSEKKRHNGLKYFGHCFRKLKGIEIRKDIVEDFGGENGAIHCVCKD